MIKNLDILAGRLKGIKIGDKDATIDLLKGAMSGEEEVVLSASDVHVLSEDELTEVKKTVDKLGYEKGRDAGYEMTVKQLRDKTGIEFTGKNVDNFIGEFTKKVQKDAGIEPNRKITELSESLTNLQSQVEKKDAEINDWKEKFSGLEKSTKVNRAITGAIPKDLKGLTPEHFVTLFLADGFSVDFDDGDVIPTKSGKHIKDSYEKPLKLEQVTMDYAIRNKWINGDGRGGDDTSPQPFKTSQDLYKHMEKNNISPVSKQGLKMIEEFENRV